MKKTNSADQLGDKPENAEHCCVNMVAMRINISLEQMKKLLTEERKCSEESALEKCILFLNGIGIVTTLIASDPNGFLPGLSIHRGTILINLSRLDNPGDILHEAGHLAVIPSDDRPLLNDADISKRVDREAEEMMAIAWSYAACIYLGIDPRFVLHENGYKGGANYIVEQFEKSEYFGLPILQCVGLTANEKTAARLNILPYPHMIKWLRD